MSWPFKFLRWKSSGYDAVFLNLQLYTLQRIIRSPSSKPSSSAKQPPTPHPKKSVLYRHDQCRYPMEREGVSGMDHITRKYKMESIHQTVCHIPEDLCLQQCCCKNHIVHISISSFSDFTNSFLAASPSFLTNFLVVSHKFIPFCTIN